MNDREAAELLAGIDAPRPMARELADVLFADLTDPVARVDDQARPLPADLRHRLEASLLAAHPMPVPQRLRRRIEARLAGGDRPASRVGAAAAVVLLVVGVLAAVMSGDGSGDSTEVATPRTTLSRPSAGIGTSPTVVGSPAAGSAGAGSVGGGGATGSGSAAPPPFTEEGGASDAGPESAPAAGVAPLAGPIVVALTGTESDASAAIQAYFDLVNATGGIHGRPIEVGGPEQPGAVATVNVGEEALTTTPGGTVFETLHSEEVRLRDGVASLASAVEHQARLAAAAAFPDAGGSAVIYVGQREPWLTVAPNAIEGVLRGRGVATARVPFDGRTASATPASAADAVFLSLPSSDVGTWLHSYAGGAPTNGTWGVGSAWDDDLAVRGAAVGLRAVSPYGRAGGEEEAALDTAMPDGISAPAVHGWVTGKAIARLLHTSGGAPLTEASLDSLVGWDPGWAPPFAVRDGTRSRTPDGIVLVADGTRFVPTGGFLTDDAAS